MTTAVSPQSISAHAVVLPKNFAKEPEKKYGLIVHVGGFGTRYTGVRGIAPDPRFVQILPDGAGPFGDPYQVNSANNGPWGKALIEELIPAIEKRFAAVGKPEARFVTGHSSGGWSSLWLQVAYPDFFGGCWSTSPDPVDFRDFQRINLYERGPTCSRPPTASRAPWPAAAASPCCSTSRSRTWKWSWATAAS